MARDSGLSTVDSITRYTWICFLIALPLTNFPFFLPTIGGEALVRPLSLYPLIILIPLAIVPSLIRHKIPNTFLPLLAFALIAAASSMLSLVRGIDPVSGISVSERSLRALLTLGFGGAVYLACALIPRNFSDLRGTLRWIYLGAAIALFWGSLQATYIIRFNERWFELLSNIQRIITNRHLFPDRISGMTYEPNWFAEQIILLWLPWLLASVIWSYSVFNWRWKWVTVEWILLIWCVLLIPFTLSRSGLINLLIVSAISFLMFGIRKMRTYHQKDRPRLQATDILIMIFIIVIILGIIFIVGSNNPFFARIWEYWQSGGSSISSYLQYLGFDARITYSQAAINTYRTSPILGVGLGNYAFYFPEMLPHKPISQLPEVVKVITPEEGRVRLITPKNLYLRLLAETGMLGTIAFISFLISIFGSAIYILSSHEKETRFLGGAGILGLIAFTISTLTFDSFVIPNMWVLFGLITAATHISFRKDQLEY